MEPLEKVDEVEDVDCMHILDNGKDWIKLYGVMLTEYIVTSQATFMPSMSSSSTMTAGSRRERVVSLRPVLQVSTARECRAVAKDMGRLFSLFN